MLENPIQYDGKGLLKLHVPADQQPKVKTIPDLHPCLYWNPRVPLDGDKKPAFNFSTSDDRQF
jgi:hypothetical protein